MFNTFHAFISSRLDHCNSFVFVYSPDIHLMRPLHIWDQPPEFIGLCLNNNSSVFHPLLIQMQIHFWATSFDMSADIWNYSPMVHKLLSFPDFPPVDCSFWKEMQTHIRINSLFSNVDVDVEKLRAEAYASMPASYIANYILYSY